MQRSVSIEAVIAPFPLNDETLPNICIPRVLFTAVGALLLNISIYSFESFDNIKLDLKKQWAGLLYNALIINKNVTNKQINSIETKLERLENHLKNFFDNKKIKNNKYTIDIDNYMNEYNIENMIEIKSEIKRLITNICIDPFNRKRFEMNEKFSQNEVEKFIKKARECIIKFKLIT